MFAHRPAAIAVSVVLSICVIVLAAGPAPAAPRPDAARPAAPEMLLRGGPGPDKAVVDTTLVMGPVGSGAPYHGDFETGWQGWTPIDNTVVTENHWSVSDYGQAPGDLAVLCGDPLLPSCEPGDPVGGYGNGWREVLGRDVVVAQPVLQAEVRVQADLHLDTEENWDFVYVSVRREGEIGWHDLGAWSGQQDVAVDLSYVYEPAELIDGTKVRVAFRFESDSAYSDEDCGAYGAGALQVDDITVTVHQLGLPDIVSFDDFQDGILGGWEIMEPDAVGNFGQIWTGLEDIDACSTNYSAQVAFIDDGLVVPGTGGSLCLNWCYGPSGYIVNTTGGLAGPDARIDCGVVSPVMDLPAGAEGVLLNWNEYLHEDLSFDAPGMFQYAKVRWADTDGSHGPVQAIEDQPWEDYGFLFFDFGYIDRQWDLSGVIAPGADQVQVQLGVHEMLFGWGAVGDDGYPAPYFDNVRVRAFPYAGPFVAAYPRELAGDAFPEQDVLTPAEPGLMTVRFDSPGSLYGSPGDSLVVRVSARPGAVLTAPPVLHYVVDPNPAFDTVRSVPVAGSVDGLPGLAPNWSFDLPDSGLLYPGDVLHYYISASDFLDGDVRTSRLPEDITGFGDFTSPDAYDDWFTVRALPSLDPVLGGIVPATRVLFWDASGRFGTVSAWRPTLEDYAASSDALCGYDVFIRRSTSHVGSLGLATAGPALDNYHTIICDGGFDSNPVNDGTSNGGDDRAALMAWLAGGNRNLVLLGDDLASSLTYSSGDGVAFVQGIMGVDVFNVQAQIFIDNQTAPLVVPDPASPAYLSLAEWLLDGGCPGINTFDAVQARPGAVRVMEFANPAGNAGVYDFSAATYHQPAGSGDDILSFPYSLAFVEPAPGGAADTQAQLAGAILSWLNGTCGIGDVGDDLPGREVFAVQAHPNPFNPQTQIAYTVPRAGHLSLKVFDLQGRLVRTLIDGRVTASGVVSWDGTDAAGRQVASGVYFTEARLNGEVRLGKLALIK